MSKTDYDKALEWLQDKMEGGRYDGAKLLMESEAAGIKRSDIMKAKAELGVRIQTTAEVCSGSAHRLYIANGTKTQISADL